MKKQSFLIGLFALILGIGLVTQIKMPYGEKLYVSAKALNEMKLAVESEEENIKRTELQILEAEKKLEEFRKLAEEDKTEELIANAQAELDYYKMISGQMAVKGSGVKVTIDDGTRDLYEGENVNNILVHDSDVLTILNDLFTAGAEAISINDHRIIDMSSITCSGYTIRVNDIFTATPFVIKAVGDQGRLYSAMMAPGSFGNVLIDWGVHFEAVTEDEIEIPAYPSYPTQVYMTIIKEGETN